MSQLSSKEMQTIATQTINKLDSAIASITKMTDSASAVRQLDIALGNFYSQITFITILNLVSPSKTFSGEVPFIITS